MTQQTNLDVDIECIKKLKTLLADKFLVLMQNFLANTETYINDIGATVRSGDRSSLKATAHKMKSSCGQFGLMHLQALAKSIEYSEELDDTALLARCEELKPALSRVLGFIREHGIDK